MIHLAGKNTTRGLCPHVGSRRSLRRLQERAANGGTVPHMAEGASRTVRQAQQADWEEDSLLRLYLTTLAGTVIQLQVPVGIYHTWEMLEEYLVEHLPCISPIETFGCEHTLLNADTQVALQDPVQEELWNTNHFCLIVRECSRCLENNKPLQGLDYEDCPKAIRVPVSESGILEAKAFHSTTRVRHACLDAGFSTITRKGGGIATPCGSLSCLIRL